MSNLRRLVWCAWREGDGCAAMLTDDPQRAARWVRARAQAGERVTLSTPGGVKFRWSDRGWRSVEGDHAVPRAIRL